MKLKLKIPGPISDWFIIQMQDSRVVEKGFPFAKEEVTNMKKELDELGDQVQSLQKILKFFKVLFFV